MTNPVPKTDTVFLKHFIQLIAFLVFLCVALIALGVYISSRHPPPENPAKARSTDQRLMPVGAVYAGDTGRAAIAAAEEAAKAAATAEVAYGGTTDGKTIFGNLCHACHETGAGGAPTLADKPHWASRLAQGEQVKATVDWMITQVK